MKSKTLNRIYGLALGAFLLFNWGIAAQEHNWNSHAEVARNVIKAFDEMKSYQAHFEIRTEESRQVKLKRGTIYYSKPSHIRFEFQSPARDLIVSDGKILWIYINRLRAAGRQDLTLNTKDENGNRVFSDDPQTGIKRLFRKYHYRFDGVEQPRKTDDGTFFVLDMDQREKVGGYENIKLYIDPETYLVRKAIASDGSGKVTEVKYSKIKLNPSLEGKLFQYKPGDGVRVVKNPLVSE